MFSGRSLIIATMHSKENVIAPILEKELGVICKTVENLNTDTFGTFTGEIQRKNSPLFTVKAKALAALKNTNETLVVASEGSFGPHPASPFLSANEEIVVIIDTLNDLEIYGSYLTTETNFNSQKITNLNDLIAFEMQTGFPNHNIIIRAKNIESDTSEKTEVWKDFISSENLHIIVSNQLLKNRQITAETDMRAMNNPTRMKAIEFAVEDLVKNIKSICPTCNSPGFSVVELIRGLRCSLCNLPTKSVKGYRYSCKKCNHSCERFKDEAIKENPMYCDYCNP